MNNVFKYIEYYKNISFKEYKYNDVDALVFSLLGYVELDDIVTDKKDEYVYLDRVIDSYLKKNKNVSVKDKNWMFPNSYKLMEMLKDSVRYKDMKLSNYKKITDKETQFAGLTIRINGITYICYRGTDSSIIGWKEDFELIYKFPIVSQILAQEYFNNTISFWDRNIYIGGHSKGGNLSMYAYMYGKNSYKKRVRKIYNFDGPGFLEKITKSEMYDDLATKLVTVIPKSSMIGMILENRNYMVVNSYNKGLWSHDGFSWEVFGGCFVEDNLSNKSIKLKNNLKGYIDSMSLDERKEFVDNTFNIFKILGVEYTNELQSLKIADVMKVLKDLKNIPNSTKSKWIAMIKLILIG